MIKDTDKALNILGNNCDPKNCGGCALADKPEGKKLSKRCQPSAAQQSRLMNAVATCDWSAYDKIAIGFSGGKDSLACVLQLLKLGCPKDKILLMHHEIDGREGSDLYDWDITPDYCRAVAEHLGIELRFSWLKGGFEGEMYRENVPKAAIRFELPDGSVGETGGKGKPNTRRKQPAKVASLTTRWCSAVLKIDVMAAAMRNDETFNGGGAYLVLTGERREESVGRATYAEIEAHRTNCNSRDVTHWRAVLDMGEEEVWDLIKEFGIRAHPCYELGFGRCSCAFCIFASPDQLASLREMMPERFQRHSDIEVEFDHTVDNKLSLPEMAAKGTSFVADKAAELSELAQATTYDAPVALGSEWALPAGAFGDSAGPV